MLYSVERKPRKLYQDIAPINVTICDFEGMGLIYPMNDNHPAPRKAMSRIDMRLNDMILNHQAPAKKGDARSLIIVKSCQFLIAHREAVRGGMSNKSSFPILLLASAEIRKLKGL